MRARLAVIFSAVLLCNCSNSSGGGAEHVGPGQRRVAISVSGQGAVQSASPLLDCHDTCSLQVTDGARLHLAAVAASGSTFRGWGGACSGSGACDLLVDRDLAVSAAFEGGPPPPSGKHVLTVTKIGSGTVRSTPAGIDCGVTCFASFDEGATVTLAAQPDAGSRFGGWSGASRGEGDASLVVSGDLAVTATFVRQFKVSFTMSGAGRGTISLGEQKCDASCDLRFDAGITVSASAAAPDGSKFMGWTGACSGLESCTLRVDSDLALGGTFWVIPAYRVDGFGDGTADLGGIDDGGNVVYVKAPPNGIGDLAILRDAQSGEERQIWPGNNAWAVRISPNGHIALTTFRWNGTDDAWNTYRMSAGTWVAVRTLGGADGAFAGGIDDNGAIIGGAHVSGSGSDRIIHAYLEDGSGAVDLGSSGRNSSALGRRGGLVVGLVWDSPFFAHRAAVWESSGIHELGNFGGAYSFAYGINSHGVIVGTAQRADNGYHAFLWDPQARALRDAGVGELLSINDDGQAVGSTGGGYPMPRGRATLYLNGIVFDLNDLVQEKDTLLESAMFINSRGQITGGGTVRGQWGDYLLTPRN